MSDISRLKTQMLQWGRNLIVAEGGRYEALGRAGVASMGPQLDSCGRRTLSGGPSTAICFNGAAT